MAKILLVDDSEPNRDMLARRLKRKGHEVLEAADGQQAVEMTRTDSPDVILMDLNLPVLDGWSATRQIKASPDTRSIPIIALTAHAMSGDRQKALHAGCDDYDTKPIDFPRLLGKIDAVFKAVERPASAPYPGAMAPPGSKASFTSSSFDDAGAPASVARPPAGRVLVVDDTAANRDVATRWLQRKGYIVETAEDGASAIQMIDNASYDAILLDVMMPGVNGIDVLRTLRQTHAPMHLPVIMATAKDGSDDVIEALTLGANDYVTKPLDFPVVMARLETQISLKRSVEQIYRLEKGLEQRNRELQVVNQRMQDDLAAAARIQADLLPTAEPRVDGYRFSWLFEPSAGLAGDILNVFKLSDNQIGAYVLDVSGHGIAAALLSVTVSRFLSGSPDTTSVLWHPVPGTLSAPGGFQIETPTRVAERLNDRFPFNDVTRQYFTMIYGLLDTERHQFRYVSAGHPNLLHITAHGEARPLEGAGYPIGVGPGDYEEQVVELEPGDRIYVHSDGLSEAMNPSRELFGVPRMLEVLQSAHDDPMSETLQRLSESVRRWTGSGERKDDQTVLAIERVRA